MRYAFKISIDIFILSYTFSDLQDNEILDAIMENDKDTYIGMPTDKNWI